MKRIVTALLSAALLVICAVSASAAAPIFDAQHCTSTWAAPYTPKNIVNAPPGVITMHYTYTCNPGYSVSAVQVAFGCADSLTPNHASCPSDYIPEFGSYKYAYLTPQANTGTVNFDTRMTPGNATPANTPILDEAHDVNVWLIGQNGHVIGGSGANGNDSDAVVFTHNGSFGGGGAANCSPQITGPANNLAISSPTAIGVNPRCNGDMSQDHIEFWWGPLNQSSADSAAPLKFANGASGGTFNPATSAVGAQQAAVRVVDGSGNILGNWGGMPAGGDLFFTVTHPAPPTSTPTPAPSQATSANPAITAPANNSVLSGVRTLGATANGVYDHIEWGDVRPCD